jgi:hypothetical protein
MQRTTPTLYVIALVTAAIATGCGSANQEAQERERFAGRSYELPVQESELPSFDLTALPEDDTSLSLADCAPGDTRCAENKALIDMLKLTRTKLAEYVATGHNVFAAGIALTRRTGSQRYRCVYVEIQERSQGKKIRLESLTPAGQPSECSVPYGTGITSATIGAIVKIGGNNWAAGVGVGAVYYDGAVAAGCAVGAVGYASEVYGSYGTVGAFCTEILALQ